MSLAVASGLLFGPITAPDERSMTATSTFDAFSSLDGSGAAGAEWTGCWGKQGPEWLDHRLALYGSDFRGYHASAVRRPNATVAAGDAVDAEATCGERGSASSRCRRCSTRAKESAVARTWC